MQAAQQQQESKIQAEAQSQEAIAENDMKVLETSKSLDRKNELAKISGKGQIDIVKQGMKESGDTKRTEIMKAEKDMKLSQAFPKKTEKK